MKNWKTQLRAWFIRILLGLSTMNALAQTPDTLKKCDQSYLLGKVIEINSTQVKYKMHNYLDGPVVIMRKSEICAIHYANGTVQAMEQVSSPSHSSNQPFNLDSLPFGGPKHSIKADLIKPIFNCVELVYEHNVKPGITLEGGLGYIGINATQDVQFRREDEQGMFMRFGVKFHRYNAFNKEQATHYQLLEGKYIKPEITVSAYNYRRQDYDWFTGDQTLQTHNAESVALMLKFGRQYVFAESFTIDLHIGAGFSYSDDDPLSVRRYSHQSLGGFAWDLGVRTGWAF